MTRKISQRKIKQLEKSGGRVNRRMGTEEPKPKAAAPAAETREHASMAASMAAYEAEQKATNKLIAHNSEVLRDFRDTLKEAVKSREPSPYTFDIERDDDKLLSRVLARPGIVE